MDAKDVRIFCEMAFGTMSFSALQERHVSPSEIGRKLGMDEKTVRTRIKKMEDDGFIKYYQVAPNLNLFGLTCVGYYRLEAINLRTKYNLLEHTHGVPFVIEVIDYLGQAVSVAIAGPTADGVQQVAERLAFQFELGRRELYSRHLGECALRPDNLDWRIMKELRYSARRSPSDLASVLSVTPRMAEYRIGRLLDSGAMLLHAAIDPRKQTGLIFYELELAVSEQYQSSVATKLAEEYNERLWSTVSSKGILIASLFGFSLGEAEDAAIDSAKLQGVKSCLPYFLKETIEPRGPNWIDHQIEQVAIG